MRARYGPEVKPQEVVDRRWAGGRLLALDGFPHRGQPICLSEFGGIAQLRERPKDATDDWGYAQTSSIEAYEDLVCRLIEVVRSTAMFSGFCYTQFADTFQEVNGLLNADRTPKIPFDRLALAVRGP